MIRYSLTCEQDHAFEGWFKDSASFDKQVKAKAVACPACGSTTVSKALMAPAVTGTKKKGAQAPAEAVPVATPDPRHAELIDTLRQLKKHVVENSEYVGERFAEEARKIHYEEADKRSIYGEASLEDAKSLIDEGVELHPLPILPEDKN
ncbi:DUF1178 family protein [Microbaculum marinisediminis]|uniref:DUF1178 family protein n=1 Tax=Microbaculum marinisediminis TaxID=2931392 RepID=A0AAW5QYX9_9HYPH|nr:DUF1178 family protein [Microbaculum sp. A6E488]MCT8971480.1 DUF1178 family protein [Microbaculum sp. A6E488]